MTSRPDWSIKKFGTEYLAPQYYDTLLKRYAARYNNEEDLDLLSTFIKERPKNKNVLELGCGSGRGTQVIAQDAKYEVLTLTDLSKQMLEYVKLSHAFDRSTCVNVDHFTYLQETTKNYDLVVSLWSLAHSMFPWFQMHGVQSFSIVESIITKFISTNLNSEGRIFIIQTDGASEEQSLIKRSWFLGDDSKQQLETQYYKDLQSPSIWILSKVFENLIKQNVLNPIQTNINRVPGAEIEYTSVDEALEIFMNFHLEGEFNESDRFDAVYAFLKNEFEKIQTQKGKLAIGTGFWMYRAQKL